jgi:hypothetical protein
MVLHIKKIGHRMITMEQQHKGFTSVELAFSLVTVVIVIALGWLVYKDGNKKTPTNTDTTSSTSSQTVSSSSCPSGDTTVADSYNKDSSDSRVTCALAYGQQMSNSLQIDNGVVAVVSALYATKLGSTAFNGGDAGVVNVLVKNVSSSDQTYDLKNFALQLPNGQQIHFNSVYGSSSTTLSIASGGTAVKTLLFTSISPSAATAGQGELMYTSPTTSKATDVIVLFKTPYTG